METTRANGSAIRTIRTLSGYNSVAFAALLREAGAKCDPAHLRNIELGYKQPSPKLLDLMAQVLRCPKAALLASPSEKAS